MSDRRPITLLLAALTIAMVSIGAVSRADQRKTVGGIPANPDDRTILHVLNRLGFGARPGV